MSTTCYYRLPRQKMVMTWDTQGKDEIRKLIGLLQENKEVEIVIE